LVVAGNLYGSFAEGLAVAGALWSRCQRAVRKGTGLRRCVQQRGPGRLFGKGKLIFAEGYQGWYLAPVGAFSCPADS